MVSIAPGTYPVVEVGSALKLALTVFPATAPVAVAV
jgi:hypothetical protein